MKTITNLRILLEYFEILNRDLAQAINVSPSMVSNWVQGKRTLRMSSGSVTAIADYVLSKSSLTSRDIIWLKKHFEQAGISAEFDSASEIKRNLIIWLADDGQEVLAILKKTENIRIENEAAGALNLPQYLYSIGPAGRIYSDDYSARAGAVDISLRLSRIFQTMDEGLTIDICLSSEMVSTMTEDVFIAEIIRAFQEKNMRVRMLIALSNNAMVLLKIINAYSQLIINGHMEIYTTHGMVQPMIHQTSIFIPNTCAVAIIELPDSLTPPAALFITESLFIKDAVDGFDRVVKYTQPLMQSYPDNKIKSIVDLLNREFCDEGDLDILSDGMNPLMLDSEEYIEILKQRGLQGKALQWRSEEYLYIKGGLENNLKSGSVLREIISAEMIKDIVINGICEVPALYFMDKGKVLIDQKACLAILKGYIKMLKTYPNYHLAIAQQLDEKQQGTRHIKQGRHITLNSWKRAQPILVYSEQIIMIHEFQMIFNELWVGLSAGTRENTISLLAFMIEEIVRIHK